nr:titin-like [Zootoca vivipara]
MSFMHSWSEKQKPSFTQKLKYRSVMAGEPVVFQCKLSAVPLPQITWYHNNRQIPQSLRRRIKSESCMDMHSSSLEVNEVQERDSGSYKVFAINSEGSAESTASLLVACGDKQNAKYLEFLRQSERTCQRIEHLVQKRRGDRLKVDLRCIGSPFDKKQETEKVLRAFSPTKGMVRTISFESLPSLRQEFVYDKDWVRNRRADRGCSEGEALLDEETKVKLQRLREAKKAMLEKKKVLPSQGSTEEHLPSAGIVGIGNKRGPLAHSICAASHVETKGLAFQTIEQINEKAMLPTVSGTKEVTVGSSSRELEKKSEKFQVRMERILGLPGPPQILQEFPDKSNRGGMFRRQEVVASKGNVKPQVPEKDPKAIGNTRWMNHSYTHGKSEEARMDTQGFKATKNIKKDPSPLVYVLFTDDVSEREKPDMVMSDTITMNINEPAPVFEIREMSKTVETAKSVNKCSLETEESVLAEVTETETEITEPPDKLVRPLPKYLEPCPPFFVHEIESQEVSEGESCIFNCDFQGHPQVTVTWYNNDKPLSRNQECNIRTTENSSTLTFSAIVRDHEGSITCVIFNQHGTATTSGTLKVNVKEKPEFEPFSICKVELSPDYAEEEEELSLAFEYSKKDEPDLSMDGRATLLPPQINLPRPCISDPDLLSLPVEIKITAPTPTPEQDEEFKELTQFVEFVPEEAPEEQTSAGLKHKFKFSFDVAHEPPQILKEIQQHVRCREGDSVVLECLISAEPLPIVTWLQNDGILIPTEKFYFEEGDGIYRLHVCKVSISDAGTYKCVAENKAGIVETVCYLSVDPAVGIFSDEVELKAVQSQVRGARDRIAKEHLGSYFESSVGLTESSFSDKAYSVSQQFHSVSKLDFGGEETGRPAQEMESQLPSYLNDVMKSLLADESESPHFQIWEQNEVRKEMESNAEEGRKVASITEILADTPLVEESRDTAAEQAKVESTYKQAAMEISSSCQFEMVVESHTEREESVTGEDISVSHDVKDEGETVRDIFEIMQQISKDLEFTRAYLEPESESLQYGPTQGISHEEIPSSEIITDIPFKEVKEQTCTFEQELSAKESMDHRFSTPILKMLQEDSDIHEKDQCFTDILSKNSQDQSAMDERSMLHLQNISNELQSAPKEEQLHYEVVNKENMQEAVANEQQELFRVEKEQAFRSSISDKEEGTLIHEEKFTSFGEGKEKEICCGEELVGKAAVSVPEFVFDLKQMLTTEDSVDKNAQEQSETQELIGPSPIAGKFDISLDGTPVHAGTETADEQQNRLKSEEVYVKEKCLVSEIIQANTNKITKSAQIGISALEQRLDSSQGISKEGELVNEANYARENALCLEKEEFSLHPASVGEENVVEEQEEIIIKELSDFQRTDLDKIIESAEVDTSAESYSQDINKEKELGEEGIFDLKQLSLHVENDSQNQEDVLVKALHSGSEEMKPDVNKTPEIVQPPTLFLEQERASQQELFQDTEPVKAEYSFKEAILSFEEFPSKQSNYNIEIVVQEEVHIEEKQTHEKDQVSVFTVPDIEIIGGKYVKTEYSAAASLQTDVAEHAHKKSDLEVSKVNETIKEESDALQQSLPPKNGIFDLKQAYSDMEKNSHLSETEETYLKNLYSASEGVLADTQSTMENTYQIMHSSQKDSFSLKTMMEEENVQECTSPENKDIDLKLAFLNLENVDQQQEEKLPQGQIPLKFLYSASEETEAFQGQQLKPTESKSVLYKSSDHKECTLSQGKELQTQEQMFDLKAHAASLSQDFSLKEAETLPEKEVGSFNLRSAFEMVGTETESFIKQLQKASVPEEEGVSLSEELRQSYKLRLEGDNFLEQKLQAEAELTVTQILKKALETISLSTEQEPATKRHGDQEGKFSEEEVLRMPDEAFLWGQPESVPLSQYFQNQVKETGVLEADSFISDLKKAAHGKKPQSVHETGGEKARVTEHTIIKARSSSTEGTDIETPFDSQIMPDNQPSSHSSAEEPSLAQFLLSLKDESLISQGGVTGECETAELMNPPLGNLSEGGTVETTLHAQELPPPPPHEGADFSLTKYLLAAREQETPIVRDSSSRTLTREGSITSLEVEDVTFSTVYDYYKQQQELTRPFSPESEMSIDIDSMSGDEMVEAEGFYTPPSSVDNFESPMSFESYHTPIGSPERYSTPSEERYSTPSEERYSTPSEERYSTPSEERYSTPSAESNRASMRSPANLVRGSTPPERYQTPPGSRLQHRSSSLEELRAEMFGTPCEALEPKGNEIPPAFIKPLTKRKLYENTTLRFIAEVIGTPIPDVKWYRNKSLLEQDERVKIQKEGDICILEICNIQKTDGGEYMCHAINIIGESKNIAQVQVLPHDGRALALPPPVTHQHVIEFDIEQGSASRTPSPQEILLEVELDETEIKECEKQVKIATIPKLTSDDQSMIVSLDVLPLSLVEHTMASFGKENEDVTIDFEVTEMPPRFTTPVSDIEVPEKSEALFHCTVSGCPTPVVQWFKANQCISSDAWKYAVRSDNGNHSLKIQNVQRSDSGMYLCKAVNAVGEAICRCLLAVTEGQGALPVTNDGGEADLSLDSTSGRPQKIDLLVDNTIQNGNQTEIELEFEFEGDTDDSQKAVKLVAVTEQEQEEEGEACVNINFDVFAEPSKEEQIEFKGESTDRCSFEFHVTEAPPKFMKHISDCASFMGTSASFQCLVGGSPKPAISWFKNGALIHEERYCMEESQEGCHSLTIRSLVQTDEGEYKCVATNKAGTAYSSASLTIC